MTDAERLPKLLCDCAMTRAGVLREPLSSNAYYNWLKMNADCVRTWRACGGKLRGVK